MSQAINPNSNFINQGQNTNSYFDNEVSFKDTIKAAREEALTSDKVFDALTQVHSSLRKDSSHGNNSVNYDFSNFSQKNYIAEA